MLNKFSWHSANQPPSPNLTTLLLLYGRHLLAFLRNLINVVVEESCLVVAGYLDSQEGPCIPEHSLNFSSLIYFIVWIQFPFHDQSNCLSLECLFTNVSMLLLPIDHAFNNKWRTIVKLIIRFSWNGNPMLSWWSPVIELLSMLLFFFLFW